MSHLAKKHLPVGTDKHTAVQRLDRLGFNVKEVPRKKYHACPSCDDLFIEAWLQEKTTIPLNPQSIIQIQIGIKNGKVASIQAHHSNANNVL